MSCDHADHRHTLDEVDAVFFAAVVVLVMEGNGRSDSRAMMYLGEVDVDLMWTSSNP